MSSSDYLHINNHKIFKTLHETLPKNIHKTERLLAVNDDVFYTWNFQDNCVLTLNIKAVRSKESDNVSYQTLLPNYPLLFAPEHLVTNSSNTLLAVSGPSGVLVMELPARCPPHGAFGGNKEVVYCRSHSLDERLLCCGNHVEVHQVRFHPGSPGDNHIVVLTSDNFLRFYQVVEGIAITLNKYQLGRNPSSVMPCSKVYLLTDLGETVIDFDFGPPELSKSKAVNLEETKTIKAPEVTIKKEKQASITYKELNETLNKIKVENKAQSEVYDSVRQKNLKNFRTKWGDLQWPIYLLYGNTNICTVTINLSEKSKPKLRGPLPVFPEKEITLRDEACALICLKTTPPVLCMATTKGNIYHLIVLPETEFEDKNIDEYLHHYDRSLYLYEKIELELGLSTCEPSEEYICPIFLYLDDSRNNRYFAIHETGVHSIIVPSVDGLQKFVSGPDEDLENVIDEPSSAEYVLCTKIANLDHTNPVIGFTLYYDPPSMLVLLSNGHIVILSLLTSLLPTYSDDFDYEKLQSEDLPLNKMLKEPFDIYIQRILNQVKNQPILKVSGENRTQKDCYELLQRVSHSFRENHIKYHEKAAEEIIKRVKTLRLLKNYQLKEIDRMQKEKLILQEKAGYLAEKYEDIKDKQEELTKRCHQLLLLISEKKTELSDAEKKFLEELKKAQDKALLYTKALDRLKKQQKYQDIQMENWKQQNIHKETGLGSIQSGTIRNNLQDMSNQISDIIKEINEYKTTLGLN